MDDLLKRIEADKINKVEIDHIKFTLKEINTFTITDATKAVKESGVDFDTELLLSSIVNCEGLKVKDCTDKVDGYTAEELETLIPFNRKYVEYYLALNPAAIGRLKGEVFKSYVHFAETLNKKKLLLDTLLSGQSSKIEKNPQRKTRTTRTKK